MPRGRTSQLIGWANGQPAPAPAFDVPGGLDPTLGARHPVCHRHCDRHAGAAQDRVAAPGAGRELYVADIGIPPGVYQQFGISAAGLFHRSQIVAVPTAPHPNPPAV